MPKNEYEKCKKIALIYNSISEMKKNDSITYNIIKSNEWWELVSHIKKVKKHKLTHDYCMKIALECESLKYLSEKNPSVIVTIRKNCWVDILSKLDRLNRKKLTYIECKEISSKYTILKEFYTENLSMAVIMRNNGWFSELTNHMTRSGSKYKRCIYAYEFKELNSVYIGLTFSISIRDKQHRSENNSSVFNYCNKNGINIPEPIQLTDYIDREIASKLEGDFLEKYKKDGWYIINMRKTGNLGGNPNSVCYTKEICINLAKGYKQKTDFINANTRAYAIIRENGWGEEAYSHMKRNPNKNRKKVSKIDKTTSEIIENYDSAHEATKENNMSSGHIVACCNGKRKTAGGYIWKYI